MTSCIAPIKKYVGYIYRITNTENGKKYIGATMKNPKTRFNEHVKKAFDISWKSNSALHQAIRDCSPVAFKVETIVKIHSISKSDIKRKLEVLEQAFIRVENTYGEGYNQTIGGRGTKGYHHTKATRKQISIKMSLQVTEYSQGKKRPIVQLTKDGDFVKYWDSTSSAAVGIGISRQSITNVLNHNAGQSTAKGFRFVYKSQYDKLNNK